MDQRLKMLLAFQALPVVFALFLTGSTLYLWFVVSDYGTVASSGAAMLHPVIIQQFRQGLDFVWFFLVIGIPFEVILFYFDRQDQQSKLSE